MRIGVTGAGGRLGSYLVDKYDAIQILANVTSPNELAAELRKVRPEVIIHCAAYTSVDGAEKNYESAYITNVIGTSYLRQMFGGKIVFLSTSFVYDGKSREPYPETNCIYRPINYYGWTKLLAEIILDSSPKPFQTLRTVSLYGPQGKDFMEHIISRLGWDQQEVRLPAHLIRAPTYIPHLAEAIMFILENSIPDRYINVVGETMLSLYDLGKVLAERFDFRVSRRLKVGIDQKTIAKRPRMGALSLKKAWQLKIPTYSLEEGLECLVNDADYL